MADNLRGLRELISDLNPDIARQVVASTLNKVAAAAQREANREVRKYYSIKAGDVKRYQYIQKANKNKLASKLIVSGTSVPIYKFGGQSYISRRKGNKIYYGASAKVLTKKPRMKYKDVFPVVLSSGHIGAFRQTGERMRSNRKRMAIRELRVITAATMFDNKGSDRLFTYVADGFIDKFMKEYRSKAWRANKFK